MSGSDDDIYENADLPHTGALFTTIGANTYANADYTIPAERNFREAWENSTGSVLSVNMTQAKNIWRDKIREARPEEFAKLDADYMKALETGASTTQIVTDKQALRDAPADPRIDAATTPDELKAVQPIPNVTIE
jgi:hypothetical protein